MFFSHILVVNIFDTHLGPWRKSLKHEGFASKVIEVSLKEGYFPYTSLILSHKIWDIPDIPDRYKIYPYTYFSYTSLILSENLSIIIYLRLFDVVWWPVCLSVYWPSTIPVSTSKSPVICSKNCMLNGWWMTLMVNGWLYNKILYNILIFFGLHLAFQWFPTLKCRSVFPPSSRVKSPYVCNCL